jgi:hypothetical protein
MVIYEPFDQHAFNHAIQSVEKTEHQGIYAGLIVISKVSGKKIPQYILSPSGRNLFVNDKLGIRFAGTHGLITLNETYVYRRGKGNQLSRRVLDP